MSEPLTNEALREIEARATGMGARIVNMTANPPGPMERSLELIYRAGHRVARLAAVEIVHEAESDVTALASEVRRLRAERGRMGELWGEASELPTEAAPILDGCRGDLAERVRAWLRK